MIERETLGPSNENTKNDDSTSLRHSVEKALLQKELLETKTSNDNWSNVFMHLSSPFLIVYAEFYKVGKTLLFPSSNINLR